MKPSQFDTVIAMLTHMQASVAAQDRKIDQLTQFIVAHSSELNDVTNLLRNYVSATSDLARDVSRLKAEHDDHPPGYSNGKGGQ